ncbi:hypothetical protein [Herbaspirillum sp. RV1423]|uniref:hypothetical protein n=1 Tax=Herbaspirillum sp. RV1423 TaxID=1443993 RepID=UPI00054D082A|nr:hypothetical protein [Herbaspirillum sp. RV1423]
MKFLSKIVFVIVAICAGQVSARPTLAYATRDGLEFADRYKNLAAPPGKYFALVCAAKKCKLRLARLSNQAAKVDMYDYDEQQDGYVQRADINRALAFVRGIPGLKEGPVKTWYFQPFRYRDDGQNQPVFTPPRWSRTINVNGTNLHISGHRVEKAIRKCPACEPESGVIWKMAMGTIERTLISLPDDYVQGPEVQFDVNQFLVWVGDIDSDGKPDLLLQSQSRSGGVYLQLFLSTTLQAGKPWKPSAKFSYWPLWDPGC